MKSRMNKYESLEENKYQRSKKNTKLYEEVYDDIYRDTTYKNMEVIDSAKEINLNKLKDILDDKYDTRQYRTLNNYVTDDIDDEPIITNQKDKVHDINEIINKAKSKRTFIEEALEKQKYMDYKEKRESKYNKEYETLEKEEKELEELINTMALPKIDNETKDALDMFSDLKGSENTIVTNPINTSFDIQNKEEKTTTEDIRRDLNKTLMKADRAFYTDSNMFTKNDFEDFSTLTNELKRSSRRKKILILFIILLLLSAAGFYAYFNYFSK